METLNLNGMAQPKDNFFQRIFWPTIHNQYDVDTASRRGFWLAVAVGVFSALSLAVTGHWLLSLFLLATYWLGANGIRERSLTAAILLLSMYLLNLVFVWLGMFVRSAPFRSPLSGILGIALLVSCVRATLLSRRFAASGDVEFPERDQNGFANRLVDALPPRVWPATRVLFFVLAALMLLLSLLGQIAVLRQATPVDSSENSNRSSIAVPDERR